MAREYLLGVDLGTSGTKTVLFDRLGREVASKSYGYAMHQPHAGWAEQDPADWWAAACATIKGVLTEGGVDPADVKGLGISGQMHGAVLLGPEDEVLRNAIIWCDQRSARECDEIHALVGRERLVEITANPALTGFTAAKVMWVRNNEPEVYARIAKILLPKDYVRFMLTGEYATEVSDAGGMQYMDVPGRRWSGEVMGRLGIADSWLGKVYESCEVTGRVSHRAAALTGLREGTPVVGGAGDNAAGAVGNGIVRPGMVFSTIGTSGVVFAYSDDVTIDRLGRVHTFCHAVPGKWHVMGVTQGAGLSLQWFRNNFCSEEVRTAALLEEDPYALMDREAALSPPCCDGLTFLPYMMGERTPHLDPYARAVFFGITARHSKRDMLRAVMEGVIFSLKDCLGIIEGMGVGVSEVRASGGGGRSALWRQMQADVFGVDITTAESGEGPALGAAILAAVGTGLYPTVEEACSAMVRERSRQSPQEGMNERYMEGYGVYRALYPALAGLYPRRP